MADTQQNTFEIPESRMGELESRLAKLAKIAAKLQSEAPAMRKVGETHRIYVVDDEGVRKEIQRKEGETVTDLLARATERYPKLEAEVVRFFTIEVTGPRPKLTDWYFLAKLEHTEAGTMIQKLSDEPVPEQYRQAEPYCDHCKTDRRRRDTYVVSNGAEVKQVGRTCLKDFTGHQSPEYIAQLCSYIERFSSLAEGLEDDDSSGFTGERVYSLMTVLEYSAYFTNRDGYKSKKAVEFTGQRSTGSDVAFVIFERDTRKKPQVETHDQRLAADALAWAKTIEAKPEEDYLWNLSVIVELGYVKAKRIGLAASIIRAYQRHMEIETKKAIEKKQLGDSEWFGNKGDRKGFVLNVLSVKEFDGNYGSKYLYRFLTPKGDSAVWWASNEFPVYDGKHVIGPGDTIRVKATIKAHDTYREIKQTCLTRVQLIELLEAESEEQAADVAA